MTYEPKDIVLMTADTIRTIQEKVISLVDRFGLNMNGADVDPTIREVRAQRGGVAIYWNDESMELIAAGHIACSVYDEFEKIFSELGLEVIDGDPTLLVRKGA